MLKPIIRTALALAGTGLAANLGAQEYFCWFDNAGVQHCGDKVPPEHARHDREVLNDQGVVVRMEEGEITAEERAEIDRSRREEEERLAAEQARIERDQMLLNAYVTVDGIEKLRDRRLEVMDSQIRVTEILLTNLQKKLEDLTRDAQRFAPYSDREDASPLPENLAIDIDRTESAIALRETALDEIRRIRGEIVVEFQRDIDRFRQLTDDHRVPLADSDR